MLVESASFSGPLVAGLVCGAALRCWTSLRAYRTGSPDRTAVADRNPGSGGGSGSGSGDEGGRVGGLYGGGSVFANRNQNAREARRQREAQEFVEYQAKLLKGGKLIGVEDEEYWESMGRKWFHPKRGAAGINFEGYKNVKVEREGGQGIEEPVESFQELCEKFTIRKELQANFERCRYNIPTPVQKHAISAVLANTDVMVSAQTGSGKTAAFMTPMINNVLKLGTKPLVKGPVCPIGVVLAPTRELCQQIGIEAKRLAFRTPIRIRVAVGGLPAMPQLKLIAEGCEILIATPGRLEDFIDRGAVSMAEVKYLVLDEADKMLDMGFEDEIRSIIEENGMPPPGTREEVESGDGRQTMMLSATFPEQMQDMALDYLHPSYMWIAVGRVGSATTNVEQRWEDCTTLDSNARFMLLADTLKKFKQTSRKRRPKTIIFANRRTVTEEVAWKLENEGFNAAPLNGDMQQGLRYKILQCFRQGLVDVLVATDIASRGLDLPGVDHVINYELPSQSAEDYVHRIGRTARIGNQGVATSMVSVRENHLMEIVYNLIETAKADGTASPVPAWVEARARTQTGVFQSLRGKEGTAFKPLRKYNVGVLPGKY